MKPEVIARVRDEIIANELRAAQRASTPVIGAGEFNKLTRGVRADLYGAGPLQELLEMSGVTDVLVNGPNDVWIERGMGLEPVDVQLGSEQEVRALAVRLAATAGRRLDDAQPAVDARLADGVRLHAILPPLAPNGTTLSLRVPSARPLGLSDLIAREMFDSKLADVFRAVIARRISFVISGGTGTGKTTLLSALLAQVPASERLVVIEEAQELNPDHPHVVYLQTRLANVEGAGRVGLSELVRHALRMRPDRIVLGECRGAEIRELLTAFNTGHGGGGTTLHANTAADVPARIAALGALGGMDRFAAASQTASALRVLIHLRHAGGRRWVSDIALIANPEPEILTALPAWHSSAPGEIQKLAGAQDLEELLVRRA